jgi:hypothetical protein
LLAACVVAPNVTPASRVNVGISNGTTLLVSLFVNGELRGVFPAHAGETRIDVSAWPPLPWTVEARSVSGRVLTSMHIEPGQVSATTQPGGFSEYTGTIGRVDLSCGRLTMWGGDIQPSGPAPPPFPGKRGDCLP